MKLVSPQQKQKLLGWCHPDPLWLNQMPIPVYNYLNVPIILHLTAAAAPPVRLGSVPPHNVAYLEMARGMPGDVISVELPGGQVYQRLIVNRAGFRAIHIGQVTTRYEQGRYDLQQATANAVQGLGWVQLHNQTDLPLNLNGLHIPAHASYRYNGRGGFGIPLGTTFRDTDGLYKEVRLIKPVTDVYFGFTSDLQQATFGGFMLGRPFPSDDEPTYLLNEGYFV